LQLIVQAGFKAKAGHMNHAARMTFFLFTSLGLFAVNGSAEGGNTAQRKNRDSEDFYTYSETRYKDMVQSFDASSFFKRNVGTSPTNKDIILFYIAFTGKLYQGLIDELACLKGNRVDTSCYDARYASDQKMYKFEMRYSILNARGLNVSACKETSRLRQMEMRYPPYEFMKISGYDAPEAYNAKSFLKCVGKSG
jgi:hypothetical protein